jgi:hypothetical protein
MKAIHELAQAPVHIHMVGELVRGDTITFLDATGGMELALDPSTNLLVIQTTGISTARRTINCVPPAFFLQNHTLANVLFWPEEHFPDLASVPTLQGDNSMSSQLTPNGDS